MKCLICDRPLIHARQTECECGESLSFWTAQLNASNALRQRGLAQAAKRNYASACASFLEAALANPADQRNLIDAAKALAHGGCYQGAKDLLENADGRYNESKEQVLKAIQNLERHAKQSKAPPAPPKPVDPPAVPVEEVTTPPIETIAPENHAPPSPPPSLLLGLGVLKRRAKGLKSVLPWAKSNYFPTMWTTVLQMENSWPRDWQSVEPWLRAAAGEAAKTSDGAAGEAAVFHYMLGLAHVQAGERDAAVGEFDRCLALKPPVLNAAAYYLYLHLDHPQNVKKAMDRLEAEYDKAERDECRRQLHERLSRRGEAEKAALLK